MSKNKIMRYMVALLLFLLAGGFLPSTTVQAASADIDITSDTTQVTLGDSFFVYITINSDTQAGDVEAHITYDDDILEYQSETPVIKGSGGFLKLSDLGVSEGTTTRKYTMKFEAIKVGTCEIAFQGRAMVYDFESGLELPVSSTVLTINVKAQETASENAFLKTLKISPSQLEPEFDKNTFEYNTSVGYETEQLIINALTEDSNATVSISGNDFLKEGENKIIITVLAESGDVIEYIINVDKAFAPDNGNEEPANPDTAFNTLEVLQTDGKLYAVYGGRYELVAPDSTVSIPKGYKQTRIIISDVSISAYYPEDDLDSEFLLIYAMNDKGEAGFYRYDKVEKTLQRFITIGSITEQDKDLQTVGDNQDGKYHTGIKNAELVIAILCVLCVALVSILIIIVIRQYMKSRGFREDDLD